MYSSSLGLRGIDTTGVVFLSASLTLRFMLRSLDSMDSAAFNIINCTYPCLILFHSVFSFFKEFS